MAAILAAILDFTTFPTSYSWELFFVKKGIELKCIVEKFLLFD